MSRTENSAALRSGDTSSHEAWWPDDYRSKSASRHKKPARPASEAMRFASEDMRHAQPATAQGLPSRQAQRSDALSRALMYVAIALLMALLFVQIGRLAQIAAQTKRISTLQASIREMQNEKSNLLVRLSMQQNINRVRDEAIYKLGMIHPEDGQIRVVSMGGNAVNARTQTADNLAGASAAD